MTIKGLFWMVEKTYFIDFQKAKTAQLKVIIVATRNAIVGVAFIVIFHALRFGNLKQKSIKKIDSINAKIRKLKPNNLFGF